MARNGENECVFPPRGEPEVPPCSHDSVVVLGQDAGNNLYKRCRDCESVILVVGTSSNWEEIREEQTTEPRDRNPLLDPLRRDQAASDDARQGTAGDRSLAGRVRSIWNRFRVR